MLRDGSCAPRAGHTRSCSGLSTMVPQVVEGAFSGVWSGEVKHVAGCEDNDVGSAMGGVLSPAKLADGQPVWTDPPTHKLAFACS